MFTTRPELAGTFGMTASTHWLASSTGMSVLERGGNAFDAAVAMAFVLHVAEPHMCGPGGDVPIILAPAGHEPRVLCGQGPAPAGATIEHYRSEGLTLIPPTGLLAPVVPGAVPGWLTLLHDFGTWSLRDVLEPAIGYAEAGVPLHPAVAASIAAVARRFHRLWPTSVEVYLVDGEAPRAGTLWRWPALAATWRRLIGEGEAAGGGREAQIAAALHAWSEGFVADAIDRHARKTWGDGMGRHYPGVMRGSDLAAWQPVYETPVSLDYGRYEVFKCGPWSQGPVLLQSLALLRGADLDSVSPDSADFVHLVTEAMKLAYADRDRFYADPDFADVPLDVLLSPAYNDARRRLIGRDASADFRPGDVAGFGGDVDYDAACRRAELAGVRTTPGATSDRGERGERGDRGAGFGPTAGGRAEGQRAGSGEDASGMAQSIGVAGPTNGDTCHLDVVDRWGNLVSATPSGGWLHASPVVEGLGFPLGSRAQMFWLDERHPCSLQPGKRPRSTLTPSFARRDGTPWLAFGTPGGDGQDQWQLAFFLRIVHHGRNLQEAVDSPGFHSDHMPSSFWPRHAVPARLTVESRFDPEVVDDLRSRGHDVVVGGPWSEGRLSAVAREDASSSGSGGDNGGDNGHHDDRAVLRAAANPRGRQGYAVGR
jgi:gamma-glutamyltranspeptidase/glutathione hydrolase